MDQLVHNGDPDDELHSGEPDDLDENVIEADLYNSYSLGSRQQYRVRAGEKLLVAEQSRAAGPIPPLDSRVRVGWDSADAIFVEG